ncbi:hypothetical protein PGT21_020652 [Puccinia graminis f. sp. tritici]|uniref:Uncharacterized protein n=1 Tax=Puccinia graminis f. sp. tritici TaxID=56615 RepID=A0A5B0RG23_PUCGR|nr:hypothetical protein PGT21_020652 [Puccinia graminis f. sp. tritici]KAA1124138.1 hypothetical protein PGTUg99_029428 [Puccinia graminis f. sp. tritici]
MDSDLSGHWSESDRSARKLYGLLSRVQDVFWRDETPEASLQGCGFNSSTIATRRAGFNGSRLDEQLSSLSASEKEFIQLARDVRGISVATNSRHPSLSPILLHHQHPRQYEYLCIRSDEKTQSLKIDRPIKKNGPDDDLGSFRSLPLRHRPSELDDKPI